MHGLCLWLPISPHRIAPACSYCWWCLAGEDTRSITSLLAVLVPAIAVPCVVVGLIVALGNLSRARRAHWHKPVTAADGYTLLDAGPGAGAGGGHPLAEGVVGSGVGSSSRGAMGLGILKAMSRRARAKRMRRSCRPAYVGLPEQSAQQHRWVWLCRKGRAAWQQKRAGGRRLACCRRPVECVCACVCPV